MIRWIALFAAVTLIGVPRHAPAEPVGEAEVLALLEASLAAGEGGPARALLDRYLTDHPKTPRIRELEILVDFYSGDYEAAAERVERLRRENRRSGGLGTLADVIVDTYETTKNYETVTLDGIEVRYAPGPDEILVPYAIDALRGAAEAMRAELGVEMVSPIRLEIYPDAESLAQVSTLSVESIRNTGTIALCKWGRLMIASPRALMRGYPWLDTIAHEYAHLVVTKASLDRAPVWLQEGLAKLLETRWRSQKPSLPFDPASQRLLIVAAEEDELLDFDRLHPSIALLPSQKAAALAFAQVSSFMEMFYEQHGAAGVQEAIAAIATGTDARKALAAVAERPWKKLENQWKVSLVGQPPPPEVRLLPRYLKGEATEHDELAAVEVDTARKHLRLGDLLWSRSRPNAASVEYGKAHAVAPGDPVVASRYARSALAGGRPAIAIRPLLNTLELYPTHAPAHSGLAAARLRTGDLVGAEESARRAIALNPFDPQPHCVIAELEGAAATNERSLCSRLGGNRE